MPGKSKKGKSEQIPQFLDRLYTMMEDSTIEPVVQWTTEGNAINIRNIAKFTEQVLPAYYKHKNYSSFIRQLNMYGFNKLRHPEGEDIYANKHFRRGCREGLKKINRKIRQAPETITKWVVKESSRDSKREMVELRQSQKNLEQICRLCMRQNQQLIAENNELLKRIEKQSQDKEHRIQNGIAILLGQHLSSMLNGQLCLENSSDKKKNLRSKKKSSSLLDEIYENVSRIEQFQQIKKQIYGDLDNENVDPRTRSSSESSLEEHQPAGVVEQNQEMFDESQEYMSLSQLNDADNLEQIHLDESR